MGHSWGGDTATPSTNPYILFVGAILRRAVMDAQGKALYGNEGQGGTRQTIEAEALAFLRDTERLGFFVELMGADVARVQSVLLQAVKYPDKAQQ